MLWAISYESYPRTKIMEVGQTNLRKVSANTENYVKTQMRENHGEIEKFHYNNSDYIVFFGVLGFLAQLIVLNVGRDLLFIHVVLVR